MTIFSNYFFSFDLVSYLTIFLVTLTFLSGSYALYSTVALNFLIVSLYLFLNLLCGCFSFASFSYYFFVSLFSILFSFLICLTGFMIMIGYSSFLV